MGGGFDGPRWTAERGRAANLVGVARRFGYYDRLSAKEKATYRKSDAVTEIDVPDLGTLAPLVATLEAALTSGKRLATAKASTSLVAALCRQLGVPPVEVKVRMVRPAISGGELHGLYTFRDGAKAPRIEVWMRTAAHEQVVKFRTFLRTLLHEVGHHLDVTLLELDDSFHTEGFFRRESSLVRQLAPRPVKTVKKEKERKKEAEERPEPTAAKAEQLSLFGGAPQEGGR